MRKDPATWVLATTTFLLGAAALTFGRPVVDRPAASVLAAGPRASVAARWRTRSDSVRRGESVLAALKRSGLDADDAARALKAVRLASGKRVPAGTTVVARSANDSAPSEIVLQLAVDRLVRLSRSSPNAWRGQEERLAWTTDTVAVSGVVRNTLTSAIAAGASAFPEKVRTELAYALADILEYRVDLGRELHQGDSIHVLLERQRTANGLVRPGQILAARLRVGGRAIEAVHFAGKDTPGAYFDGEGKSMRAAFLRAPVAFRRISSVFGLRMHPILGVLKQHEGTDYAAPAGTPVRALGAGVITYAGWKGGYGNVVEIRHQNGIVTRYGHLRAFASGISRGTSVEISRTIGFVGMTGLATAPHLHFEVLVNGRSRDTRVALRNVMSEPMAPRDQATFSRVKSQLFARLNASAATASTFGGVRAPAAPFATVLDAAAEGNR